MSLRRTVLGLAITTTVAAGCSSSDTVATDAAAIDSPTAAETGGGPGNDAGMIHATMDAGSDLGVTPAEASVDAPSADVATAPASDSAADGSAAVSDATTTLADGSANAAADGANGSALMCGPFANGGLGLPDASPLPSAAMSFFVSSVKSMTGNLGGLAAADTRCQTLAAAVGVGSKTWHAYLSVEHDASNGNNPTNARDRIGAGPWYNARGALVAANLVALHGRTGDPTVFLDENGNMINGQWTMSPKPNEHDILTGSNADGTLAPGKTCLDWTSAQPAMDGGVPDGGELSVARVGHTDGFGPTCATIPSNLTSWNSAHDNAGCDNTAPKGGAGRIYCFATH